MPNADTGLPKQILKTATTLLVDKGYHGMSMRDIAEALNVSKAALYYYFKDKEELFLAILNMYLDDLSAALDRILAEPISAKEKIGLFAEYVLTQPAEQRATIRLATQEINQLSPEARGAFGVIYREKFVGKVQAMLEQGMQSGEFRPIQPDVIAWALLGIMFPYFYPSHDGGAPVSPETIAEVVRIFLNGVCA